MTSRSRVSDVDEDELLHKSKVKKPRKRPVTSENPAPLEPSTPQMKTPSFSPAVVPAATLPIHFEATLVSKFNCQ